MRLYLMRTPRYDAGIGVGQNERQGLITDREIELGRLLLPHLRRAVTISNVLDVRTIEGARTAEQCLPRGMAGRKPARPAATIAGAGQVASARTAPRRPGFHARAWENPWVEPASVENRNDINARLRTLSPSPE
jgi:hypothetical protein